MSSTVAIPVELFNNPEITPQAFRLIAFIMHKADEAGKDFELHTKEWAQTLNCAPCTLRRWVKYLTEKGYVVYQNAQKRVRQYKLILNKIFSSFSSRAESSAEPVNYEELHKQLSETQKRKLISRVHERLTHMVGIIEKTYEHEQLANKLYKEELGMLC